MFNTWSNIFFSLRSHTGVWGQQSQQNDINTIAGRPSPKGLELQVSCDSVHQSLLLLLPDELWGNCAMFGGCYWTQRAAHRNARGSRDLPLLRIVGRIVAIPPMIWNAEMWTKPKGQYQTKHFRRIHKGCLRHLLLQNWQCLWFRYLWEAGTWICQRPALRRVCPSQTLQLSQSQEHGWVVL